MSSTRKPRCALQKLPLTSDVIYVNFIKDNSAIWWPATVLSMVHSSGTSILKQLAIATAALNYHRRDDYPSDKGTVRFVTGQLIYHLDQIKRAF